jgi:hypothetical protein
MLNFLGIGAQKAGTTWLFKRLSMHPNIYFPRGKEMHFWDKYDANNPESAIHYTRVFGDGHFYRQNRFKIGEITPEYATLGDVALEALQDIAPDVRIFYSLRDPAERMWSALKMHLLLQQKDIKNIDIGELLEMAKKDHFYRQTEYATNLSNWSRFFPKKQICVVMFDRFNSSPYQVLTVLSRHIGIDEGFYQLLPPAVLGGVVFEGHKATMPREVRAEFIKMFDSTISGVEDFIGGKLPGWRSLPNDVAQQDAHTGS